MNDDAVLLRRFVEEGSEEAFTVLVQRYLDLVYGAALRRTGGDVHRAADVAQEVFTALARQARRLSRHTVLSAWLHTATRNIAVNLMMSEQRRKSRELAAGVALEPPSSAQAASGWEEVRPALDAAIDELSEPDRVVVVLRFLERRPFAEIGAVLHITADAARMRTERALDKLRTTLARRGISSTAAALGALVSTHSSVSAPAGLATTLVPAVLGAATAVAGTWNPAIALLVNTKIVVSLATVATAIGLGFYLGLARSPSEPSAYLPATSRHSQAIAVLRKENLQLRTEIDRLRAATQATPRAVVAAPPLAVPPAVPKPATPALTVINQQRAMLNNLRMIAAAIDQFQRENGRPPASLDELVGETKYLRRLDPVAGESYTGLALLPKQPMTVITTDGVAVTFDPAGATTTDLIVASQQAQAEVQRILTERFGAEFVQRVTTSAQKAAEAYRATHNGKPPPTPGAAIPYFSTPQEGADFVEFAEAAKALGMRM